MVRIFIHPIARRETRHRRRAIRDPRPSSLALETRPHDDARETPRDAHHASSHSGHARTRFGPLELFMMVNERFVARVETDVVVILTPTTEEVMVSACIVQRDRAKL